MAKKITGYIKLQVPAGAANPSPPIGPALGQRGLAIMEFCKQFNAQTQNMEKGSPIPVVITVYQDRSFTFEMRTPPVSYFIKKAAKLESGIEDAGPRQAGKRDQGAGQGDRREEDEGFELRYHRGRDAHGGRLRPFDGHRGRGVIAMTNLGKRTHRHPRRRRPHQALSARRGGEDGQGAGQGQVRRDHRGGDESRRRSAPRRSDGARRRQPAERLGPQRQRVAVFARGAKADEAKAAGADVVGAEDLVDKVQGGNIDFDRCIATPDLMPLVGRLGKVSGPRGMMPNPKVGTVTMDVTNAVKGAKGGSVEFRVEKAGIVQAGVGKASFPADKLVQNIKAFADAVQKAKPAGAKGTFINRVAISSTMGPGVKVEPASLFVQQQSLQSSQRRA